MIPGPVEMSPEVREAAAAVATSHVSAGFISSFGNVLRGIRTVFGAVEAQAQPMVIAGSGSLGWDMVACNCLHSGDEVLVITHGFFGDAFRDVLVRMCVCFVCALCALSIKIPRLLTCWGFFFR